jgi:hypothetical protein
MDQQRSAAMSRHFAPPRIVEALAPLLAVIGLLTAAPATAEPYLAVESGLKCANCHVNPAGGGKRNLFGTLYARNQIAARAIGMDETPWNGDVTKWFSVGGDFRGGYQSFDIPGVGEESETEVTRATVYAWFKAIPNLLSFYFDQKVAPDDSENREAYLLLTPGNGKYTVKVGQMFLPFGLRLEDDDAFVRQASGINFNTPADGVELGLELPKWSAQLNFAEGPARNSDVGDHVSLSAAYVQPRWRVGASYNTNDDRFGDREMVGVFAGLKTGPFSWLAEVDSISDDFALGGRDQMATLIEGNWRIRKGHSLKVTYEYLEPDDDRDEDEQERYSAVWEYSPIQFVQSRVGFRSYNGFPNFPVSNREELFAELHVYF